MSVRGRESPQYRRRFTKKSMTTMLDRLRVFNTHVLNRVMLRLAGRKHW
jgi:hypothetical protein